MDIYNVRAQLALAASAVALPKASLTCTGYMPDAVNEPCFFIADYTIDFDKVMQRGLDAITFTARVLVSRADDLAGQKLLDNMMSGSGTASLKDVIENARGAPGSAALNGYAHDFRVSRMQGIRLYEHNGLQYLGAEITIDVIGDGSA
ncbi:hypothetical protein [Streptomyces sp. NBC_01451]|uniref:hypothetical protein n=1 Tax=Streptomyces sp. NBC_01451 TaxID=2903872 RepID=UPI002E36E7B9|nr:hypothetical protein [Streptomyces sp. NBC_01451]